MFGSFCHRKKSRLLTHTHRGIPDKQFVCCSDEVEMSGELPVLLQKQSELSLGEAEQEVESSSCDRNSPTTHEDQTDPSIVE